MTALKQQEIDVYLKQPDPARRAILVYGPDSGLVSERADRIAAASGVDLKDPFATMRLDAETVAADRTRLLDEVFTVGMFGGERLIRVSGQTRRNLAEAVKPVIEAGKINAWLILEAGDLKKQALLRTLFERSTTAVAVPCYLDADKALEELIRQEVLEAGYTMDRDTITYLRRFLGGDRLASRNELRKLVLYAGDTRSLTREHIQAVVGDASAIDSEDVYDAVVTGHFAAVERDLPRLLEQGTAPDMILLGAMRYFQRLHEMRGIMERNRIPATAVIDGYRPPIFFNRKNAIARALAAFDRAQLERVLTRLQKAAFEARANPDLAASLAGTCLLAIGLEARRR